MIRRRTLKEGFASDFEAAAEKKYPGYGRKSQEAGPIIDRLAKRFVDLQATSAESAEDAIERVLDESETEIRDNLETLAGFFLIGDSFDPEGDNEDLYLDVRDLLADVLAEFATDGLDESWEDTDMIRCRLWESERLENLRNRSKGLTSALSKRRERALAREQSSSKQSGSEEYGPERKWSKTELRELDMAELEAAKLFDILQEITDTARELKEEQGIEIKIRKPGLYSFGNSDSDEGSRIAIYPEEYDGFGAYYNIYEGKLYCGVFYVNDGNEISCSFLEDGMFEPSFRDDILNVLPSSSVGGKIGTFYKNIKKMLDTAELLQDEFEAEATKKLDAYERKEIRGVKESRYRRNARLVESRRRR